jgi:hypothetical protein
MVTVDERNLTHLVTQATCFPRKQNNAGYLGSHVVHPCINFTYSPVSKWDHHRLLNGKESIVGGRGIFHGTTVTSHGGNQDTCETPHDYKSRDERRAYLKTGHRNKRVMIYVTISPICYSFNITCMLVSLSYKTARGEDWTLTWKKENKTGRITF